MKRGGLNDYLMILKWLGGCCVLALSSCTSPNARLGNESTRLRSSDASEVEITLRGTLPVNEGATVGILIRLDGVQFYDYRGRPLSAQAVRACVVDAVNRRGSGVTVRNLGISNETSVGQLDRAIAALEGMFSLVRRTESSDAKGRWHINVVSPELELLRMNAGESEAPVKGS